VRDEAKVVLDKDVSRLHIPLQIKVYIVLFLGGAERSRKGSAVRAQSEHEKGAV